MAKTIFITGGCGFIGSHVARAVAERGDWAVLFDQQAPRDDVRWLLEPVQSNVTYVTGSVDAWPEVIDAVGRYRPDAIVHTAAIGDPAVVQHKAHLALRVNVEGSLNVLEATRLLGVPRIVLFS